MAIAQEIFGGTPAASLDAFADGLAELPLVYQPGERWSYSVGLDLLGRVIEVVSGQSFDAFLQERIFEPMRHDQHLLPACRESEADASDRQLRHHGRRAHS